MKLQVMKCVNSDGSINVNISGASTSTVTSVASSASSVTLLATNTSRKMATIYNESQKSYTFKLVLQQV